MTNYVRPLLEGHVVSIPIVYIAGPYRALTPWATEQHIRNAEYLALAVWRKGAVAVCPHTMTRFYGGMLGDAEALLGTLALLERCDAVVMVDGWEASDGSRVERSRAHERGLPVFENFLDFADWLDTREAEMERQAGLPL